MLVYEQTPHTCNFPIGPLGGAQTCAGGNRRVSTRVVDRRDHSGHHVADRKD